MFLSAGADKPMEPRRIILLVDDSAETLAPLTRLFQLCGYDVVSARTAAEAMALAAAPHPPDLDFAIARAMNIAGRPDARDA